MNFYQLPNGWVAGIPDYKVTGADGKVYEVIGIPPDFEMAMNYDSTAKDEILEKAISLASESE